MGKYTNNVWDDYDKELEYLSEEKDKLRNLSGDVDMIEDVIEKLRNDFVCSAGYFLVVRFIEEQATQDENGKLKWEISKELTGKEDLTYIFEHIDIKKMNDLTENQISQYVDILKYSVIKNKADEILEEWDNIFRRLFKIDGSSSIITREEAFKIAHGLHFSYDMAQSFLLRVREDDGLVYTKSEDIIEMFCFLHCPSNSCEKAEQLKTFYDLNTKDIPKATIDEKLNDFTENIRNNLENIIRLWEHESRLDITQPKTISSAFVEEKFKKWLIDNAHFLDIPSKSAYDYYCKLIGLLYLKSFPDSFHNLFGFKTEILFEEDTGIEYKITESLKSLDTLVGLYNDDNVKTIVNDIVEYVNNEYKIKGEGIDQSQKHKNVLGYVTVDGTGDLILANLSDRMINILTKKISVKKADILLAIWMNCIRYEKEMNYIGGDKIVDLCEGFINTCDDILQECNLPELYIPHLLENTFLRSLLHSNKEEKNISTSVFHMYKTILTLGMKEPIRRVSEKEREENALKEGKTKEEIKDIENQIKADEIRKEKKKRNKRSRIQRKATEDLDLEGLGEELSRHFLEHFKEKGAYWFKPDGIFFESQHGYAYKQDHYKICDYKEEKTKNRFNTLRSDFQDEDVADERRIFMIGIGNYLSKVLKENTSYRCGFRTNSKVGMFISVEEQTFREIKLAGLEKKILSHFINNREASGIYVFKQEGVYCNDELVCSYDNHINLFDPHNASYEIYEKDRKEMIQDACDFIFPNIQKNDSESILGIEIFSGIILGIRKGENYRRYSYLKLIKKLEEKKEVLKNYIENFDEFFEKPSVYILKGDGIYTKKNNELVCNYSNNYSKKIFDKENQYYFEEKKDRNKVLKNTSEFLEQELNNKYPQYSFKVNINLGVGKSATDTKKPSQIRIYRKEK